MQCCGKGVGRGRAPSCYTDWLDPNGPSTLETLKRLAGPILTVMFLAAALVGGLKLKSLFDAKLSIAQERVIASERDAVIAEKRAEGAEERASIAREEADSASAVASAATERARANAERYIAKKLASDKAILGAPDTCAPFLDAVAAARDLAAETAEEWRQAHVADSTGLSVTREALDSATIALTALRGSSAILRGAATNLVEQSKRSFLEAIIPDLGVGGAVGIDPFSGKFSKTVGLTLSWSF